MRIIVTHLTRMEPGYICVAGIDLETGRHIRPVLQHRLRRSLLGSQGGPFDLGAVVDLGPVMHVGSPPEVEDHSFNPREARWLRDCGPGFFWRLLDRVAGERLSDLFGPELRRHGRTYAVDARGGSASLGVLRPASMSLEREPASGKVRVRLSDGGEAVSLSLTDLRFFAPDQQTARWDVIEELQGRLRHGVRCLICVGLTRPYRKLGDPAWRHYLQANNLHLEDRPLWQERAA